MKTYKDLFTRMLDPQLVADCAYEASKGKIRRSDVSQALIEFDKTYRTVVDCITDPSYRPCEDNRHTIVDGSNQKVREIEKPRFCPEQIIHHLLIEGFKPVLLNGLYDNVFGCLPPVIKPTRTGKQFVRRFGPHAAVRRLCQWVQVDKKLYIGEADIHHAYASVNIEVLARQLERVIKDRQWLRLMYQFLHYNYLDPDCGNVYGLTLGHYTSPWLFNFYLKEFDHFIAALDHDIKYLRFADNLFLVGPNKRRMHRAMDTVEAYLRENLHMELNSSKQVYRREWPDMRRAVKKKFETKWDNVIALRDPSDNGSQPVEEKKAPTKSPAPKIRGRAVNALGMIIHYNRCTLRKNILRHTRRKALRIARKGKGKYATWHDGASMFSLTSWLKHTKTYKYYSKYVKPNINKRALKAKVRAHSRKITPYYQELHDKVTAALNKHIADLQKNMPV